MSEPSPDVHDPPPAPRPRETAHVVSLRFGNPDLERIFHEGYLARSLPQARISLLLGVVIYAAFGLLDPFIIPELIADARIVRFAIMCPAIIVGYGLTYTPAGKRHLVELMATAAVVGGVGVIWFATRRGDLAPLLYGAGVPLLCVYAYTFMRLPFLVAALTMVPVALAYLVIVATMGHLSVPVLVSQVFFTASFSVAGLSASYAVEWHDRTSFLQRRTIAERTLALQQALDRVTTLSRLLPMCAWCRKVRDDQGYWDQVEGYLAKHIGTSVSHGICPECKARLVETTQARS